MRGLLQFRKPGNADENAVVVTTYVGGVRNDIKTPNNTVNLADTWYHIVAEWNGGAATAIYINGVSQPLQGATGLLTGGTVRLTIGNRTDGLRPFDGQIADVQIFNTPLNGSQVSSLYTNPGSVTSGLVGYWGLTNASSVPDFSGQGNNGTNNGATTSASAPPVTILNTGTNSLTLTARTGGIQGSGAGTDINTAPLTATAVTGIGSATQLVTSNMTSGSATTSGAGAAAINIANSGASARR